MKQKKTIIKRTLNTEAGATLPLWFSCLSLLNQGAIMLSKLTALILAAMLIACGNCEIPDPEPETINWTSPPCTLSIEGWNNFDDNSCSFEYIYSLALGMETGNYFHEVNGTRIIGYWKPTKGSGIHQTVEWLDYEITPTCGTTDDTVVFTTTEKNLNGADVWYYLDTATISKYRISDEGIRAIASNASATQVKGTDLVRIIWGVHCDIVPQASHCEVTDTMAYTLIFGTAYETCAAIANIEFCWANGDTNNVGTTHRQEWSVLGGWIYNFIAASDSARGIDTCIQVNLLRADGAIVAWDTLDRAVTAGQAPTYEFQIVLLKLPVL